MFVGLRDYREAKTLNLLSCGPPTASSHSSTELLPWVQKAFKGSEFVLSIVLFQLRECFSEAISSERIY